jgi:hypothetical protein
MGASRSLSSGRAAARTRGPVWSDGRFGVRAMEAADLSQQVRFRAEIVRIPWPASGRGKTDPRVGRAAFEPRIYRGFKRLRPRGVQVGQRAALYPLPGAQETSRDNWGERLRWVETRPSPQPPRLRRKRAFKGLVTEGTPIYTQPQTRSRPALPII